MAPNGTWHPASVHCAVIPVPFESLTQIFHLNILKSAFQTIELPLDSGNPGQLEY